ncbi:MAG: coenzyme F420 hydrogenase [Bacteroidales bacterium]|nr:coenzyme F420 hydrogenase [Bacteroidales bacterium]
MRKPENITDVIRHDLCNRCGSCVGLSGGKIVFGDRTGKYLPIIKEPLDETTNRLVWQACSGKGFDFPEQRLSVFGDAASHPYIGHYQHIYIGYAKDPGIRLNAASGGIISAILIWLLEKKMIDGAVVLGMSETEPWLTRPFIATTKEEILQSAQSKYIISSVNEILPEINDFKGILAYVGLPGQVQSIRLLQQMEHPSVRNIRYIFGPFYGNTLHFSSVKSFLRSFGQKDYTKISKLYFRYGEWPGNMRVEMKDGKSFELPKFHANYLIPFHILKNSLLCTDLSNEYTDISGGDAWAPVYEERGKGFSMVISRSGKGQEILDQMVKEGRLQLDQINEKEAVEMHSHGYDLKKRGTFIRMQYRSWLGKPNPDYGYRLKGFPFSRYLMEIAIDGLFIILGTGFARWIVEKFPPGMVGKIFEKARKIWKKSTHKVKRERL